MHGRVGVARDLPAARLVGQVRRHGVGQVFEVPPDRHIGLVGDEDVRHGLQVGHVRLEQQGPGEHGFVIAPAYFAVTEGAEADPRLGELAHVGALVDVGLRRDRDVRQGAHLLHRQRALHLVGVLVAGTAEPRVQVVAPGAPEGGFGDRMEARKHVGRRGEARADHHLVHEAGRQLEVHWRQHVVEVRAVPVRQVRVAVRRPVVGAAIAQQVLLDVQVDLRPDGDPEAQVARRARVEKGEPGLRILLAQQGRDGPQLVGRLVDPRLEADDVGGFGREFGSRQQRVQADLADLVAPAIAQLVAVEMERMDLALRDRVRQRHQQEPAAGAAREGQRGRGALPRRGAAHPGPGLEPQPGEGHQFGRIHLRADLVQRFGFRGDVIKSTRRASCAFGGRPLARAVRMPARRRLTLQAIALARHALAGPARAFTMARARRPH